MNKILISAGLMCLMLAVTIPATAQGGPTIDPGTAIDPAKVGLGPPGTITFTDGCNAIPDDAYDGTQASMACFTVPGPDLIIDDINVVIGVNHTWAGDLVYKVTSPAGTTVTLMSRPGFVEPADDGTGCCGNNADMSSGFPLTYDDSALFDAENTGASLQVVCQDDGECEFFPNPGAGPGVNLADFIGEDATGDWQVCAGDSAGGDAGEICQADLLIEGATVPTVPWLGIVILLAILSAISLVVMRRRAHNS